MSAAPRRKLLIAAIAAAALVAGLAFLRGGLLGLPRLPPHTTLESSGLGGLDALATEAAVLDSPLQANREKAIDRTSFALALCARGETERGLQELRAALAADPSDLVIGNAYRLAVLRLIRQHQGVAAAQGTLAPALPSYLEGEPIAFLERLHREHPSREMALQLALAWVDQMLLYPALEIKAPASVESVEILTEILEGGHPAYVPALYARGLNYLHRPARLVWPESRKAAPDAASRDIGTAVAIGRRLGVGSARLKATLALALGDAYAKEGRAGEGRSWWQIARTMSPDPAMRAAVERRMGWSDRDLLDRLEAELEARMRDLDRPMTDLSMIWERGT